MTEKPITPEDDEFAIIRRICAGFRSEYEILVTKYQRQIHSLVMRQVGNQTTADELTQDTFVKAYLNLKSFKYRSSFQTWVIRIALNTSSSYFASKAYRQQQRSIEFDADSHEQHIREGQDAEHTTQVTTLRTLLPDLKPKYRDVITLCALEGRSYQEVSEILQIPVGTVSSRMTVAIKMLREKIQRVEL